tara:strand:- start:290 stop:406 length:117 start_codon:yes stop_codon:yes gene_type:complete
MASAKVKPIIAGHVVLSQKTAALPYLKDPSSLSCLMMR